jgi:hypothetical protein
MEQVPKGALARAYDLLRPLELAIDAAVPLFQPGGIPWQIEMYEVRAIILEVEAKLKIQNLKELEQLFRKTVWHP